MIAPIIEEVPVILNASAIVAFAGLLTTLAIRRYRRRGTRKAAPKKSTARNTPAKKI